MTNRVSSSAEAARFRSDVTALVAAAGYGTRLGHGPKAFLRVGGDTLLELVTAALNQHCQQLVIAVPPGGLDHARQLLGEGPVLIEGGGSRQLTVLAMLEQVQTALVLVHDVARPFIPGDVVERLVASARTTGAATAALAVADSVIDVTSSQVVDRDRLRLVQTPQVFATELLREAHAKALADGVKATDDAALVRRLGRPVELVTGSHSLSKITTPADLELAEAMLQVWRKRKGEVNE